MSRIDLLADGNMPLPPPEWGPDAESHYLKWLPCEDEAEKIAIGFKRIAEDKVMVFNVYHGYPDSYHRIMPLSAARGYYKKCLNERLSWECKEPTHTWERLDCRPKYAGAESHVYGSTR